jgi:hypothetical protein
LKGPGRAGTAASRADALYDAPFEDFTKLRNELAKELRKSGDRAAADEVAGMRKPTRAAWAVNQVARGDRPTISRVLEAGERLRKAQEEALGGGSGAALRKSGADEREAVGAAVEKAAAVLGGEAGRATLERVRSSLQAAARDDAVRAEIEAGRLTADHEPVGLGSLGSAVARPPSRPAKKDGPSAAARRRHRDAQVAARESNRRLEAARRELERRSDAAARARQRLEQAQADMEAAAAEAAQADGELERAEKDL